MVVVRDVDKLAMRQRIVQFNVGSARNLGTSFMIASSVNGLIRSAFQKALQNGASAVSNMGTLLRIVQEAMRTMAKAGQSSIRRHLNVLVISKQSAPQATSFS